MTKRASVLKFVLAGLFAFSAIPVAAQDADIVVEGLPDRPATRVLFIDDPAPTIVASSDFVDLAGDPVGTIDLPSPRYADSLRFANCVRNRMLATWHIVLDTPAATPDHAFAQDRLVRRNRVCHLGIRTGILIDEAPALGDSMLDLGALYETAVRTYGADIHLNRSVTFHPVVRQRFIERERAFVEGLPGSAREMRAVTNCLVQVEPGLAKRLFDTEPRSTEQDYIARLLILQARICVGEVPEVTVARDQFRYYLAESLYHWMVAAKGETLVPDNG